MPRPAVESPEELLGMFDAQEHGLEATFTAPDGSSFTANVIFERPHYEVDVEAQAGVSSSEIYVEGPTEVLAAVEHRWQVVVGDGEVYTVFDRRDDGTGVTRLILHKR